TLSGDGPFTVFAPTDAAFAALPAGTVQTLLRPENRDQLISILTYHVISGRIASSDLLSTGSAQTASGVRLPIGLSIGGAAIVQTDITAENGIIHVIDSVLLPPANDERAATASRMSDAEQRVAREARNTIALAIDRGAPLYNAGQERACAAIYEVAATALLTNGDLPERTRVALESGLERASRVHVAEDQAWRLREGLDAAYASLGRRMMTSDAGR
ncbi:MAG: transforming growth factor-beta-induced protein, partial [Rhodothermales bacterium]